MRFPMSFSVAAISITFLQLCVCAHVTAALTSGCDGGQAEGDKWFDGCRWCVCENSKAVCSSSACSDLNTQLPACEDVGESWWDGCYRCTCLADGIECTADRTCVALLKSQQSKTPSAYILSKGACIKPRDSRCVCGVDGVPSCTADAIDRNALEATTIQLVPSLSRRFTWRMSPRRPVPSSFRGSPAFLNSTSSGISSYRSRDGAQLRRPMPSWRRTRSRRSACLPLVERNIGRDVKARLLSAIKRGACLKHADTKRVVKRRHVRSAVPVILSVTGDSKKTPSLLVSTDNRCRWGSRWYGGGLRCYCDRKGAITCGDPEFVAARIDGFQMERIPCSEGDEWEETRNCRYCECHVSGIALCWRAEYCPYPFVIAPVIDNVGFSSDDNDGQYRDRLITEFDLGVDKDIDEFRTTEHNRRQVAQDTPPDEDLPGSGDAPSGAPAIVSTRECIPGQNVRVGCDLCSCTESRVQSCTRTFCGRFDRRPGSGENLQAALRRPPSSGPIQRTGPIPPTNRQRVTSCGEHQVGDTYYEECNSCQCLSSGPRCTAMSC